jgi:LacI family transcriptional regulator
MARKRVALLIETSTSWGSQIIAGISDYVRRHERWLLYVDHRGVFEQQTVPDWWEGDGVIARVISPMLVRHVKNHRLPCVNVSQIRLPGADIQQVTTDERHVGMLAAQTLLRAGSRHFAYYGPPKRDYYVDRVGESFRQRLLQDGLPVTQMDPDAFLRSDSSPHLDLPRLAEWLAGLAKPAGVLAWNTLGAQRVLEACCWAGIAVPESISVLAGDHDQLVADISTPRLTCIDHAPARVGYLAAAEMERLMAGGSVGEPILVEPAGVVWRESVVSPTRQDELVAQSLAFIAANASRAITVDDLLDNVAASRRSLELRFRKAVGHGPATEIRRTRLRRAFDMLAVTDLPIKQVAARCGFSGREQLERAVRAETSLPPSRYREVYRRRAVLAPASLPAAQIGVASSTPATD